jgi:hypothetical protein
MSGRGGGRGGGGYSADLFDGPVEPLQQSNNR